MSTMPEQRWRDGVRAPSLAEQRSMVLSAEPAVTAAVGARWERVADLLDELVTDYDNRLESGHRAPNDDEAAELQQIMDAFVQAGSAARSNAELLDDLAAEVTLAQARMTAIWNEYRAERDRAGSVHTGLIERRYSLRAAREVWYPLDGTVSAAAKRVRGAAAQADPSDEPASPLPIRQR